MRTLRINRATERYTGDVVDTKHTLAAPSSLKLLQENALLAASENRCRALLAQSVINDTASLAMSIERLSHIAPLGKPYYQDALATYAKAATKTIERW